MSLPTLFAGKSAPGLSAALDLRFALDKSLTAYRGPTPSFSRASTGSYFDGSGVLRYAALNLLTYSEDFTNGVWLKNNSSISSNVATSPTGTLTADKLVENTAGPTTHVVTYNSATTGTLFSVYAKAGERGWMALQQSNPGRYCYFDLVNGVVGIASGATGSISSAGNGWYRCSILVPSGSSAWDIFISPSDNGAGYTGNGTSGIFIWGAQLEASSTVGTYCPTTSSANSAPRFNHTYNGTSWVSRGLLVEEQRTNVMTNSQAFGSWSAQSGCTAVSNNAAGIDGGTTASTLNEGSLGTDYKGVYIFATLGSGAQTFSLYAKSVTLRYLALHSYSDGSNYCGAIFDLVAGTCTATTALGNWSSVSGSVVDCANGWYRISMTATSAGSFTSTWAIRPANAGTGFTPTYGAPATYTGTNRTASIFGAQAELGAFPTSYIPATTATTRSADVCQITGTDFSGFWNVTEGTLAVEADVIGNQGSNDNQVIVNIGNGTSSNRVDLIRNILNLGGDFGAYVKSSSVEQALLATSANAWPVNLTEKAAFAFKANDFSISYNGASPSVDTSGSIPSSNMMVLGNYSFLNSYLNGHIARLRYYNKRLPNATLQLLSEPDPTLNLQFALNKSLTPVAGPAPSFSRASTGTYFNASGVLTSASINTPRFDHVYSGGQWVSRGLLVEEQRTNGLLQSNGFGNSPWTIASSRGTVTQNAASPDGTSNAWTSECTVTSPGGFYLVQGGLSSPSATYTISFFAKKGNNGFVALEAGETSNDVYVFFDLTNGLSGNLSSVGGYTNISHGLSDCGNGWYRCRLTFTKSNANNLTAYIYPTCNAMGSLSCTSGQSNFIFGAQYETGSFPTSYTGTTSSSVTRSADVCQITGTSFNWMWNQGEGGLVLEYDRLAAITSSFSGGYPRYLTADDGTLNNRMGLLGYTGSPSNEAFYAVTGGSAQGDTLIGASAAGGIPSKIGFAYKTNDAAASLNGASVVADTTFAVPTANKLQIGYYDLSTSSPINGHIAKLIYYPARLTNTKLQQLST